MPPPDMPLDHKASPSVAFKTPPKKKRQASGSSSLALDLGSDHTAVDFSLAVTRKGSPPPGEEKHADQPYHGSVGASVQSLQVLYLPASPSDGQLVPCKSTAKRKLHDLLKNPIAFVPATEAVMDTVEPVPKRRRLDEAMQSRLDALKNVPRELARQDLRPAGIENHNGVVCYRGTVWQILMNTPVVVNWIKQHVPDPQLCKQLRDTKPNKSIRNGRRAKKTTDEEKPCVKCALRDLANAYWPPGGARRNQRSIDAMTQRLDRVMNRHNCTGCVEDDMYDDNSYSNQHDARDFMTDVILALRGTGAREIKEHEAIFGMERVLSKECPRCGRQENDWTPDIHWSLTVDIRTPAKGLDLEKYLANIFRVSKPATRCKTCNTDISHEYEDLIIAGPELLLVVLTRFVADRTGLNQRKINDRVPVKMKLDLSKYCKNVELREPGTLKYTLVGLSQHAGRLNGGHYESRITSSHGTYHITDENVTPIRLKQLLEPVDGSFVPYILAYTRDKD
ncbi:Peptidase C19 ubiquitin carboxyl-terminal hydrolase 2 [Macrophomina phaseolina MS6]|uniref:Peptidase C19 ubiquitin carboxyl-terminal hydrolase 2 n=1 Tax=Macrophomina phaseolina (strain MS6) TaxID=1126212 RepID=K2REA8_MACPH|nr:Peptidase C19 ubiquitin carboxyl-terminal hydrolase 2 [Macrophomina phaseolina MS6]